MKNRIHILAICLLALFLVSGCMLPAAAAGETTAKLNSYIQYNEGYSTISWTITGDDPGEIYVLGRMCDTDTTQRVFLIGKTSRQSIQTDELIPGHAYTIALIYSGHNSLAEQTCTVPEAGVFEDGKLKNTSVKISIEARKDNQNGKYTKLDKLQASEIMNALDAGLDIYGLKYTMKMPQLAKPRTFMVTLVLEAPDGYMMVDKAGDITFDRVSNGYQTIWFELAGNYFFPELYDDTGNIPSGTYKATLYWDGAWVNTSEFTVR